MINAGTNYLKLMKERGAELLDTEIVLGDPGLGYTGQPDKVWLMDDMRHKMVDEGVHWIQIITQNNNPYKSGFHQNPDMTDYTRLQNVLTPSKGGRKNTNKQDKRYRERQREKQKRQYRSKKKNRTRK